MSNPKPLSTLICSISQKLSSRLPEQCPRRIPQMYRSGFCHDCYSYCRKTLVQELYERGVGYSRRSTPAYS